MIPVTVTSWSTFQLPVVNESTEGDTVTLRVLAVDQTASANDNEPVIVRAVTLEVTPDQAEELVKGREEGSIQLTLRNPNEEEEEIVVAKQEPAPAKPVVVRRAPPRRPTTSTVTIIRGTNVSETKTKT